MAKQLQDTVSLDPKRFNAGTHRWNVSILTVRGVKVQELYIDDQLIPSGDYSIKDNTLVLSDKHKITENTRTNVIVRFNPTNILMAFWLPIILAIIGLVGTISQPALFSLGLLYQTEPPKLEVRPTSWSYDYDNHRFNVLLSLNNISDSDSRDWRIYVGVRERDDSVDPRHAIYEHVRGPFVLGEIMEISVPTQSDFTDEIRSRGAFVQASIFKVRKGVEVKLPFRPDEYSSESVVFVGGPSESQ